MSTPTLHHPGPSTSAQHDDWRPARSSAAWHLTITIGITGPVTVVRLSGDLDLATAPLLAETVYWLRVVDADGTVVIDTTGIRFIDLAGWRALMACADEHSQSGTPAWHIPGVAVSRLEQVIADASRR